MKRFTNKRTRKSSEPWQVIYMDLMTIIMVFFVILWSINQSEEEALTQKVGDETVKLVQLPGDVLFTSGSHKFTGEGRRIFKKIFDDKTGNVLNFDTPGLVKRLLVIHGHTDSTGDKEENFRLGYERAYQAYREIGKYSDEIPDHIVICTHADNTPEQEVPVFQGSTSAAERTAIRNAHKKNRRITIEDKVVSKPLTEAPK